MSLPQNRPSFTASDAVTIDDLVLNLGEAEPYLPLLIVWNWDHDYVHPKFNFSGLDSGKQKSFIAQSNKIKKYTWQQSRNMAQSPVGNHTIPLSAIKPDIPPRLKDILEKQAVRSVIRFKYEGKHLPVVGITDTRGTFYVIWISRKRDDVYKDKK